MEAAGQDPREDGYEEVSPREAVSANVKRLSENVEAAKKYHQKAFKRMRADMQRAFKGAHKDWPENSYTANITQRHVNQRVAALYAKNPKVTARRREKLDFRIWDGKSASLQMAYRQVMMGVQARTLGLQAPVNPRAVAIVQEYNEVQQARAQTERMGKTLELLFRYFLDQQQPVAKTSMKQLVRRACTTGVGYVKLGFHREMDIAPNIAADIHDVTKQIAHLERLAKDLSGGEFGLTDPEIEELQHSLKALHGQPQVITHEGLVTDWPLSTQIIPDPMCRNLRGFVGARHITHEMFFAPHEVEEFYGVDLKKGSYTVYDSSGLASKENKTTDYEGPHLACVQEIYDRPSGLVWTLVDGHKDYVAEPAPPQVTVENFWPIMALTFNEIEHDTELFPPSDVYLLRDMQDDYNRARQGMRQHRKANRPRYLAPKGVLDEKEKDEFVRAVAHQVTEVGAVNDRPAAELVQPVQLTGVDPNMYETSSIFSDVEVVAGAQEATFGGLTPDRTATQSSIAESSRVSSVNSNIDDLDTFLGEFAKMAGQILWLEMSAEGVQEIVGPGAVWPEFDADTVMRDLYLEIEAGSTGKPNKAVEINNAERLAPFLLQIPGISPEFLARDFLRRMDDRLDLTDAFAEGLPSIMAMNSMQPTPTDPSADPNAQGGEGGNNQAPRGQQGTAGSNAPMRANNM